jgi:hypothetical protein
MNGLLKVQIRIFDKGLDVKQKRSRAFLKKDMATRSTKEKLPEANLNF